MTTLFDALRAKLARFRADEDGNGTIEFVLTLPAFFLLVTAAVEAGVLSTRQVVLEFALDRTVREVRIGNIPVPDHETLTARICQYGSIIPSCTTNIRLEMIPNDARAWQAPDPEAACVDRDEENQPAIVFNNTGANNELMMLRACVLFDPMMPTTGLGKQIPKKSGGAYALIATTSYVMEPFQK